MRGRGFLITTAVLGLIGVGLLVFESVWAMRGEVLGDVGTTLLFVGLGLIVVAAALVLVDASREPLAAPAGGDVAAPSQPPLAAAPSAPAAEPATPGIAEVDVAASWTALCRTDCAGQLDAGDLHESLRRGATLVVYQEGVLIGVGKTQQHRTWPQVTQITAALGGNKATITVHYDTEQGAATAAFTGKNGDLAPVATALVSAAPAKLVNVSYT